MESNNHTSATESPPLVVGKFGSYYKQWNQNSPRSLGSLDIGKVFIDCKLRFSESQWGVLGATDTPAGVLYIDLTFSQPDKYRLASARVRISLEGRGEKHKHTSAQSLARLEGEDNLLAVTDHFGPKLLTGKTTTRNGKIVYNATPEIGACGFSVGGVGFQAEKTFHYENRWVLSGHPVAGSLKNGSFDATYKTLVWDLSENKLDAQPLHSNVFHTGLAFTHDAKSFFIKVEIEGRLRNRLDHLRYRFSARRNKDQGVATTLVHLGPEYRSGVRLDALAQSLDRKMVLRNLQATARKIPDALPLSMPISESEDGSAAEGEQTVDSGSERFSDSSSQLTMVDQLSAAVSVFSEAPTQTGGTGSELESPEKEEAERARTPERPESRGEEKVSKDGGTERNQESEKAENTASPLPSKMQREGELSSPEQQEPIQQKTETTEERQRWLTIIHHVMIFHFISFVLNFMIPQKLQ